MNELEYYVDLVKEVNNDKDKYLNIVPGIVEIVGGSQREERYDVLVEKMKALEISEEELWWYLDTRKFGSAVHSGFGLGFERLVLFVTGMTNICQEIKV